MCWFTFRNVSIARFTLRFSLPGLLGVLFAIGCSGGNSPVNVDVAHQTLTTAMESWKDGETPESVREFTPSIVVQDVDWSSGIKLIDYEILDDANPIDANLHAKVKLVLAKTDGKQVQKTVSYVVGTKPVLTVFRDLMN